MGLLFVVWIFSILHIRTGPEPVTNVNRYNLSYTSDVPRNIKECMDFLDDLFDNEKRKKIIFYNEEDSAELTQIQLFERPLYSPHFLETSIRLDFRLWMDSRLKRWFFWRGKLNMDSISEVIFAQYISRIKGEEVDYLMTGRIIVLNVIALLFGLALFLGSAISNKCDRTSLSSSNKNKNN